MENSLVLLSLLASAATMGYPKDKPVVVPQGLDGNTEAPPLPSPGATAPTPTVSYPMPVDRPALYPGVSPEYYSRYFGPTHVPVVLPDGHIADTAAVAAARAAHLAALERAKSLWYGYRDDGTYDLYKYGDYAYNYNKLFDNGLGTKLSATNPNVIPNYLQNVASLYYGPMDTTLGIPKGYIAEAKAAEMAREAQLGALAKAGAEAYFNANLFPYASQNPYYQNIFNASSTPLLALLGAYAGLQGPLNRPYFGPLASPTLQPNGYLSETPEVAAARAVHLSALLQAKSLWNDNKARNNLQYGHGYNGSPSDLQLQSLISSLNRGGPLATALSGYLADTPATAAARVAHLGALARAAAEANLWRSRQLYKREN